MNYLLDTCAVSQFTKKLPKHVIEWFESRDEESLFLSVVTIAEMTDGVERLRPSKKKTRLQDFLLDLLDRFNGRVLPINAHVATEWGFINAGLRKKGITIGVQDLYITALAQCHNMTVVTLNEKHFNFTGAKIINPWNCD